MDSMKVPQELRDQRVRLSMATLAIAVLLAGCTSANTGLESSPQGRWHRLAEPNLDDPLQTLAAEYIEFAPNGVLASLLFDEGPGQFWTGATGEYSVSGADQLTVTGKCWQGWQSYECSRTYRFALAGDRLSIYDPERLERRVEFERMGTSSPDLPPTLVPPMPSAVSTAQMATFAVSPAVRAETVVPDLSGLRGAWSLYVNDELGVSFEVPAAYDVEPFSSWGCGIRASGRSILFGSDNSLTLTGASGLNLPQYVDRYIEQQVSGFVAGRRDSVSTESGEQGVLIEYFLRGVNHGGIVAFFQREDTVYTVGVRLSLACSMQEIDLVSPGPFYHAVETIKFLR